MSLAACGALALWGAEAARPAEAPARRHAALQKRIGSLVAAYQKKSKAVAGVSVRDVISAGRIAGIAENDLRVPASNMKLLTSAFALKRLGGKFEFVTDVYVLDGDLIVVGDFDPVLGDSRLAARGGGTIYDELDAWAAAAAEQAGRSLTGQIILSSPKRPPLRHKDWPKAQHGRWYAAPVSQLNFFNNCFDVTFKLAGGRAIPTLLPQSRFINVVNKVRPGRPHRWSLLADKDVTTVTLKGRVAATVTEPISVPVDNPPLLLGRVLAERLARRGLGISGRVRLQPAEDMPLADARRIARTRSPLGHALWRVNSHSLNMAAECLFLRAGDGTWDGSAKLMTRTLIDHYTLAAKSFVVRDGSGLSASNRVTPAAMTMVLAKVLREDGAKNFLNSLSLAGVDEKLRKRLREAPYRGRVLAKTGHIFGAQCLSGYVLDGDKRPVLAYSILVNNVRPGQGSAAKKLHEDLCRAMIDWLDAGAR